MGATTANRLLGYPDDARLLIVNADDFGMSHNGNVATLEAFDSGILTSMTLMIPCPWSAHALSALKDRPDIPFGVHLTLVSEMAGCRWGPRLGRTAVPSLVDEKGYFEPHAGIPALLERARLDEVEAEFRAQIETVLDAGLSPTHLDWHCLIYGGTAAILEVTVELAQEYGLALRASSSPERPVVLPPDLPINDHPVLDSYSVDPATGPETLLAMLRDLPPGLSEWAIHPGLGNDEAQALEPNGWQVRRRDYDFVMLNESDKVIAEQGIELLDYREVNNA
jgi:chitin disaccharide deacetylase